MKLSRFLLLQTNRMDVRSETGFERLVTFTDAVAAISLTLLILPIMDRLAEVISEEPELLEEGMSAYVSNESKAFEAFVLSFVAMWGVWLLHHRVFETIEAYDFVLVLLNTLWLVWFVFLAFAIDLARTVAEGSWDIGLVLITIAIPLGVSAWIALHARANLSLLSHGAEPEDLRDYQTRLATAVLIFSATLIAVGLAIGFFGFGALVVIPVFVLLAAFLWIRSQGTVSNERSESSNV